METMQFLFNNKQNRQLIIHPLLLLYKGLFQQAFGITLAQMNWNNT
jgi:hypothetical protein